MQLMSVLPTSPFSHVLAVTLHVDIENSGSPHSSCWGEGNHRAGRLLLPIMTGWTSHTHTQNYIPRRIYTQRLSVKPIPPNGCSLILLTGAQGGNEVCHLYPWPLVDFAPPFTSPFMTWQWHPIRVRRGRRETEIGSGIPSEWSALTQTSVWVHKSTFKWGQSLCLSVCFDPPPPALSLSLHSYTVSPLFSWEFVTVNRYQAKRYINDAQFLFKAHTTCTGAD